MSLEGKKVIIIGGSSGIGLSAAELALQKGAEVTIVSRSTKKLEQAAQTLQGKVQIYSLDFTNEEEVKAFFAHIESVDHLVVTAAVTFGGSFLQTETKKVRELFENKFWGQYYAAKYGAEKLAQDGSITLFSGVVAYKSMIGSAALGAVNAAISNLGKTLALELAPKRVNVVSPGIIDTPSRSKMDPESRESFYSSIKEKLPVKKVGQSEDVAKGVLYLIENEFTTGTVLHVEGGHILI
ncbi:SDR family oxidoreductase [Bacillus sp. 03113]|uniref:SDR family oxidoreductase n=1 Tax=Bacillus sp. 03113 TaxID=2578211 RepID=UPI0011421B66|nr:SDR family oxidoreductase [Bacillus sp. 03113]